MESNYEIKRRILLIETTIDMLKIAEKYSGAKLNIVDDWKEVLSELKKDAVYTTDETEAKK